MKIKEILVTLSILLVFFLALSLFFYLKGSEVSLGIVLGISIGLFFSIETTLTVHFINKKPSSEKAYYVSYISEGFMIGSSTILLPDLIRTTEDIKKIAEFISKNHLNNKPVVILNFILIEK